MGLWPRPALPAKLLPPVQYLIRSIVFRRTTLLRLLDLVKSTTISSTLCHFFPAKTLPFDVLVGENLVLGMTGNSIHGPWPTEAPLHKKVLPLSVVMDDSHWHAQQTLASTFHGMMRIFLMSGIYQSDDATCNRPSMCTSSFTPARWDIDCHHSMCSLVTFLQQISVEYPCHLLSEAIILTLAQKYFTSCLCTRTTYSSPSMSGLLLTVPRPLLAILLHQLLLPFQLQIRHRFNQVFYPSCLQVAHAPMALPAKVASVVAWLRRYAWTCPNVFE